MKPGIYPGRTRHIHYQVKVPGRGNLITQCHFEGEALNANDMVLQGIRDAAQRQSVIRPIESIDTSAIGEKQVTFDIVMGFTPEEAPAGNAPVVSTRSGVVNAAGFQPGASSRRLDQHPRLSSFGNHAHLDRRSTSSTASCPPASTV